jgi:hypothetical protein
MTVTTPPQIAAVRLDLPARPRADPGADGYAAECGWTDVCGERPYLVPESMEELAGPMAGLVMLPERLDWSERAAFISMFPLSGT